MLSSQQLLVLDQECKTPTYQCWANYTAKIEVLTITHPSLTLAASSVRLTALNCKDCRIMLQNYRMVKK